MEPEEEIASTVLNMDKQDDPIEIQNDGTSKESAHSSEKKDGPTKGSAPTGPTEKETLTTLGKKTKQNKNGCMKWLSSLTWIQFYAILATIAVAVLLGGVLIAVSNQLQANQTTACEKKPPVIRDKAEDRNDCENAVNEIKSKMRKILTKITPNAKSDIVELKIINFISKIVSQETNPIAERKIFDVLCNETDYRYLSSLGETEISKVAGFGSSHIAVDSSNVAFGLWRIISVILENAYLVKEGHELKEDHVFIEIYYDSMCPDSKYFIKHQLIPTVEKIPEIIDFRLIPYGKAKTIENTTGIFFTCHHGIMECQGNKIHACGIKYITNRSKQLNFASCLINDIRNPQSAAENCALEVNANWDEIQKCSNDKEGSELLKAYGEENHSLSPSVTFIPTVVLDKNQGHQGDILKDLLKEVCLKYSGNKPPACL